MQYEPVYHKREPDLADALAYNPNTHAGAGPYLASNSATNTASYYHHHDATNTIDPYAHPHHHPHASSNTHNHTSSLPIQYSGSESYPDYNGIQSKPAPPRGVRVRAIVLSAGAVDQLGVWRRGGRV